jgi:hypothetical protein
MFASTFAPKCPEYKARTKFIRLMAMSANHFHMTWHVAGSFIRHLISGNTDIAGSSMMIFLTPCQPLKRGNNAFAGLDKMMQNVTSMVNELEIMGMKFEASTPPFVSKGPTGMEPNHIGVSLSAEMFIADAGKISFPVTMKAFDNETHLLDDNLYPFSTDTIVLGPWSLHVIKKSDTLDKMNQFGGIALLERMVKIQKEKSVVQLTGFLSTDRWVGLTTNANLMRNIKQIKSEGFNIVGNTIETLSTCSEGLCPICFETNAIFVPLECTHCFCLTCLADHLMTSVTGAECPMCRQRIAPCTKVAIDIV